MATENRKMIHYTWEDWLDLQSRMGVEIRLPPEYSGDSDIKHFVKNCYFYAESYALDFVFSVPLSEVPLYINKTVGKESMRMNLGFFEYRLLAQWRLDLSLIHI